MSLIVHYRPLPPDDGAEVPLDLHDPGVRRFRIDPRKRRQIPETEPTSTGQYILYHIAKEGRWVWRRVSSIRPSRVVQGEIPGGECYINVSFKLEETYHEVTPAYAALVFLFYEVALPLELEPHRDAAERLPVSDKPTHGWGPGWDGDFRKIFGPRTQREAPAELPDFAALAAKLRKARKSTQANLVEYMADKREATVEDVAEHVHANAETNEKTRAANANRTNDSLAELGAPCCSEWHPAAFSEKSPRSSPEVSEKYPARIQPFRRMSPETLTSSHSGA